MYKKSGSHHKPNLALSKGAFVLAPRDVEVEVQSQLEYRSAVNVVSQGKAFHPFEKFFTAAESNHVFAVHVHIVHSHSSFFKIS